MSYIQDESIPTGARVFSDDAYAEALEAMLRPARATQANPEPAAEPEALEDVAVDGADIQSMEVDEEPLGEQSVDAVAPTWEDPFSQVQDLANAVDAWTAGPAPDLALEVTSDVAEAQELADDLAQWVTTPVRPAEPAPWFSHISDGVYVWDDEELHGGSAGEMPARDDVPQDTTDMAFEVTEIVIEESAIEDQAGFLGETVTLDTWASAARSLGEVVLLGEGSEETSAAQADEARAELDPAHEGWQVPEYWVEPAQLPAVDVFEEVGVDVDDDAILEEIWQYAELDADGDDIAEENADDLVIEELVFEDDADELVSGTVIDDYIPIAEFGVLGVDAPAVDDQPELEFDAPVMFDPEEVAGWADMQDAQLADFADLDLDAAQAALEGEFTADTTVPGSFLDGAVEDDAIAADDEPAIADERPGLVKAADAGVHPMAFVYDEYANDVDALSESLAVEEAVLVEVVAEEVAAIEAVIEEEAADFIAAEEVAFEEHVADEVLEVEAAFEAEVAQEVAEVLVAFEDSLPAGTDPAYIAEVEADLEQRVAEEVAAAEIAFEQEVIAEVIAEEAYFESTVAAEVAYVETAVEADAVELVHEVIADDVTALEVAAELAQPEGIDQYVPMVDYLDIPTAAEDDPWAALATAAVVEEAVVEEAVVEEAVVEDAAATATEAAMEAEPADASAPAFAETDAGVAVFEPVATELEPIATELEPIATEVDLAAPTPDPWANVEDASAFPAVWEPDAASLETGNDEAVPADPWAAPVLEAPALEAPTFDAPLPDDPWAAAAPPATPALDTPAFDTPAVDAPAFEAPAFEAPAFDAPAFDAPAFETPAVDVPAFEAPVADDPWAVPADNAQALAPEDAHAVAVPAFDEDSWLATPAADGTGADADIAATPGTDLAPASETTLVPATKGSKKPKAKDLEDEDDPLRPRFAVAPSSAKGAVVILCLLGVLMTAAAAAMAAFGISGAAEAALPVIGVTLTGSMPWIAAAALTVVAVALFMCGSGVARGVRSWWKASWLVSLLALPALPLVLILWILLSRRNTRDWVL